MPLNVPSRVEGEPKRSRNDAAPTIKATFARDGKKHRFFEFVVPPLGGRFDGFRLKAGLRTRSCFLAVES